MPSIDIAVPCYQYGHFLGDCLDSILEQGIDELRVLVLDNASTDGSVEVAQEYARRDGRVSVATHARNIGPTACYNEAVDWAASDYFLLIDADDILAPGALRRALAVLEANGAVVMAAGPETERTFGAGDRASLGLGFHDDATWQTTSGRDFIRRQCALDRFVGSPSVLRRTAAQKLAGYYRKALPFTDDFEMWLRLALHGDVALTDTIQAVRRRHGRQVTEGYRARPHHMFREVLAAFESFFASDGRMLAEAPDLLREVRRRMGRSALYNGRTMAGDSEGAALMRLSLELTPAFALPRIARHLLCAQRPLAELRLLMAADASGT